MLLNAAGESLYTKLRTCLTKIERRDADAPVLGKHFYASLRREFAYSHSPCKRLKVGDDTEVLDEDMCLSLEDLHNHPKCMVRIMDYLENASPTNQKSLVLLFKAMLQFNPNGGGDNVDLLMTCLKFIARNNVATRWPMEWGCVRDHFDEAACKALTTRKAGKMKVSMFWAMNKDLLSLLLPRDETDPCMQALGSNAEVETQLCKVVQSSELGKLMFKQAHAQHQGGKIQTLMNEKLTELVAARVTKARVEKLRKDFVEATSSKGRDAKESLPKRTVHMEYRSCLYPMAVFSLLDEYQMREASMLESLGVDLGLVDPLFCENQLVPQPRPRPEVEIDENVFSSAKKARQAATAALGSENPTGTAILDSLTSGHGQLMQLHRAQRCTLAWWSSVIGDGSQKRLEDEIIR